MNSLNADSARPGAFPVRSLEKYGYTRARRDPEPCGASTARHTLTPELRGQEGRVRLLGRVLPEMLQGSSRTQIRGRSTAAPPPAHARPSPAPRSAARGIWPRPFRPRPRGTVRLNPLLFHLGPRPVPPRPRPLTSPAPPPKDRAGRGIRSLGPRQVPERVSATSPFPPAVWRPLCSRSARPDMLPDCLSAEGEHRCRRLLAPATARLRAWPAAAAVLVPLCSVRGVPALLYTLRSSRLAGRHKGDVRYRPGNLSPF